MTPRLQGVDPTLYLVTDTALCARAGHGVAETAAAAVRGGAGLVQVRDKTLDDDAFFRLAVEVARAVATATPPGRRVPVVINDRVAVAARLRGAGHDVHIHVGQDDLPVTEVRRRLGPDVLLGLSAATEGEFAAARASGVVDLVGIGPVFATATKADAGAALGVARLARLAATAGLPAVAIGGITRVGAAALRGSGVLGVCVVSAICGARDPEGAARALYRAFRGEEP